ncbi:MAG: DUF3035 domain-containing protein [Acidobacteria bacterium]|nr:DUF3035 domain-containing protein [Acidobacteriota bacterium]
MVAPLAACGGDLSRTFGFTRDAPDEFRVTTRAPLSMPPDYTIRPPRPGASRPQEQSERFQAEEALAPQMALSGPTRSGMTPGQAALDAQAGPQPPTDIRARVDSEAQLDRPSQTFTDRLMFWQSSPPPGTVVDPSKESQRLRSNAALGQSVQAGDTPIVEQKRRGWFDGIF